MHTRNGKMIVAGVATLLVVCGTSFADLYIQGYQPSRHDRFYSGADKAFIGQAYNWSGVGYTSGGAWATMVSPSYFVTAAHLPAGGGQTVTFYENNNPSSSHTYAIDSWAFTAPGSDLRVGKLAAPIPAGDHITSYPILKLAQNSDYNNLRVEVVGLSFRVGRNNIQYLSQNYTDPTPGSLSVHKYNLSGGQGADECLTMGGDSGGPSFIVAQNNLALVSVHLSSQGPDWGAFDDARFIDTFVPYFTSQINGQMTGGEQLMVVTSVPEPTMMSLLAIGGMVMLRRCRTI